MVVNPGWVAGENNEGVPQMIEEKPLPNQNTETSTPWSDAAVSFIKGAAELPNEAIGGVMRLAGHATGSETWKEAGKQVQEGLAYSPQATLEENEKQLAQANQSNAGALGGFVGQTAAFVGTAGATESIQGIKEALEGAGMVHGSTVAMTALRNSVGEYVANGMVRAGVRAGQAGAMALPSSVNVYNDAMDKGLGNAEALRVATINLAAQTGIGATMFSTRFNKFFETPGFNSKAMGLALKSGILGTEQEAADAFAGDKEFSIEGAFGNSVKFALFEAGMKLKELHQDVSQGKTNQTDVDAAAVDRRTEEQKFNEDWDAAHKTNQDWDEATKRNQERQRRRDWEDQQRQQQPGQTSANPAPDSQAARIKEEDIARLKEIRNYYEQLIAGKASPEDKAKAREAFKKRFGDGIRTPGLFDEAFPEDLTIHMPGEEAYDPSAPKPKDVKVDGEKATFTDPEDIAKANQAERQHKQNTEDIKNEPMTSAEHREAIVASGEALAEVKRNLKKEAEARNAVQEPSSGEVLQRQPGETGEAGSERGRVEPSVQGQETPGAGEPAEEGNVQGSQQTQPQAPQREEEVRPKPEENAEHQDPGEGATADMFGGQGAYEQAMKKMGLDPNLTAGELLRMAWDKIKSLGRDVLDTARKIKSAFQGMSAKMAKNMAKWFHDWQQKAVEAQQKRPGEAGIAGEVPPEEPKAKTEGEEEEKPSPSKEEWQAMGRRSKDILAGGEAEIQLENTRRREIARPAREAAAKLSREDRDKILALGEKSVKEIAEANIDPAIKKGIWFFRKEFEDLYEAMEKLGIQPKKIENYMGRIWIRQGRFGAQFSNNSRSPFRGKRIAQNKRYFEKVEDAFAAGKRPIYDNPFDVWDKAALDQHRLIVGVGRFRRMKSEGLTNFFHNPHDAPPGYETMDDSIANPRYTNDKGEQVVPGKFMAPAPVARAFNNYLSRGFEDPEHPVITAAYHGARAVANGMVQMELGMNGFHPTLISLENTSMEVARAITTLIRNGDAEGAAKTLGNSLRLLPENLLSGITGTKYASPYVAAGQAAQHAAIHEPNSPEGKFAREWIIRGGARLKVDLEYQTRAKEAFMEALHNVFDKSIPAGEKLKASFINGWKLPLAITEKLAEPIMQHFIPAIKVGTYLKFVSDELARLPDGGASLTEAQKDRMAMRINEHIENRMGLMVYPNLFMNKKVLQLVTLGLRSTGWNFGTQRDAMGTAADLANIVTQSAKHAIASTPTGAKTMEAAGVSPAKTLQYYKDKGQPGNNPWMTNRLANNAASYLIYGLIGTITTYLLTGKTPETPLDMISIRTGEKDHHGKDVRYMIPGYAKEHIEETMAVLALLHADPGPAYDYFTSKVNPLGSSINEILHNSDWKGNQIYNQLPGFVNSGKRAWQITRHELEEFRPFSILRAIKLFREGQGLSSLLPFLGAQTAPGILSNTTAETVAMKYMNMHGQKSRTPENATLEERRKEAIMAMEAGDRSKILEMLANGEISRGQFKAAVGIRHGSWLQSMTKRLEPSQMIEVYKAGTDAEKEEVASVIRIKLRDMRASADKDTPGSKTLLVKARNFNRQWKAVQDEEAKAKETP